MMRLVPRPSASVNKMEVWLMIWYPYRSHTESYFGRK